MAQENLNALPVAIRSLKDPISLALINSLLESESIDIILNTTSFAAHHVEDISHQIDSKNNPNESIKRPNTQNHNCDIANNRNIKKSHTNSNSVPYKREENSPLFVKNIPVIQLILAANSQEDWQENPLGLRARDLAMNIALPEMDGRIISRAIAFKQLIKHDSRCQMDIISHCLQPERAKFCLDLAKKWIALAHKPNKDKRIALILANYPTKDGRIGNGVGLDTPASTINILNAMQAAQFAVADIPVNGNALIQALLHYVTNNPDHFSFSACQQSLSLQQYQHYFEQLPAENQAAVIERWGEAEYDPKVRQQRIMLSGIRLGQTFVGIQPSRGYNNDISASYQDPDLVPPHH
jgi:cobaltochelatase CobN